MREHVQDDELERHYAGTCLARAETRDRYPVEIDDLASPAIRAIVEAVDVARQGRKRVGTGHVLAALETIATPSIRAKARAMVDSGLAVDLDPGAIAETLRQRGACRRLEAASREVVSSAQAGKWGDAQTALERACAIHADGHGSDPITTAAEHWADFIERERPKSFVPIDERLDEWVKLHPGAMLVLGAPTNVGKSSLSSQWADRAQVCGHQAGIVSNEDPAELFAEKLMVCAARHEQVGVDARGLRNGSASREDRIRAAGLVDARRGSTGQVRIIEVRDRSVERNVAAIRALGAYGCKLVVVDYLQAIRGDSGMKSQRERTNHVLNELLAAARTAGVALVLCSQLARQEAKGKRRKPVLSDLKESGDIENAAQYVVLLWRDHDEDGAPVMGRLAKVKDGRGLGREYQWRRDVHGYLVPDGVPDASAVRSGHGDLAFKRAIGE